MLPEVPLGAVCGVAGAGLALGYLAFRWGGSLPGVTRRAAWPLLGITAVALMGGLRGHAARLSHTTWALGLGLLGVGVAVACALRAAGLWQQSVALESAPVLDVDEAQRRLDTEGLSGPVLLRGRLAALDPILSPGGILCAFYEASIHRPAWLGRGSLVSEERGGARSILVRGDFAQVKVELAGDFHAREVARPCQVGVSLGWGLGPALAEGIPVEEAVSHERVGKINERCLVLGRLDRDAENNLVMRRSAGLMPMLFLGEEAVLPSGRKISLRARLLAFAAAVAVCVAGVGSSRLF